jgi:chromosome segregation ATPase
MKTHTTLRIILTSTLLAGAGLGFTGCQTRTGSAGKSPALTKASSTSESIRSASDNVQQMRLQMDSTLAALQDLTERPGDIRGQFEEVRREFAALETTSGRVTNSANRMQNQSESYLQDWGREVATIQNAELRGASFQRRDEVAERLDRISRNYQEVRAEYAPFRASVLDVITALSVDLSQRGLETARPFVARANERAEPVKESLGRLSEDFRDVGLSLKPGARDIAATR